LPRRHHQPVPKITAIEDGVATDDVRQELKQPDWTYLDEPGRGD
jgi:hypothetical protein